MRLERRPAHSTKGLWRIGSLSVIVGIALMVFTSITAEVVAELFLAYLAITSTFDLVARLIRDRGYYQALWWDLAKVVALLLLAWSDYSSTLPVFIVVLLIGAYELMMSVVNLVTWGLYRSNRIRPRWRYLLSGTWLGLLGVATLSSPLGSLDLQMFLLGGYLVLRGLTDIRDAINFHKEADARKAGRNMRVSLPIVIAALIPRAALRQLNQIMGEPETVGPGVTDPQPSGLETEEPSKPILEVFIHVKEKGFGAIGHVDLSFEGTVWSFGSYDPDSEKFSGAIGDGVLFKVDRERYVEFCTTEEDKTLFGYGIRLTEQQRERIQERLAELETQVRVWEPPVKEQPSYARRLRDATGAEFFKFNATKYKTYFVLSTNCVLLADSILGRAGTDVLSAGGFIAPGTYQDYLDREYTKPNSIVVTKRAYAEHDPA